MQRIKKDFVFSKDPKRKKRMLFGFRIGEICMILFDAAASALSYLMALWLGFDASFTGIPSEYLRAWTKFAPVYAVLSIVIYACFRLYRSLWRYAGYIEFKRIVFSSLLLGEMHAVLITLLIGRMPVSYYFIGITIQTILVFLVRFGYRFYIIGQEKCAFTRKKANAARVMLIGAGSEGRRILRDIQNDSELNESVLCLIDDDETKWGRSIDGVPIVGGRNDILTNAEKYKIEKIYLAIPGATNEQKRDILDICKKTKCEIRSLPCVHEFKNERLAKREMKEVKAEDLLGREPVSVNMDEISAFIKGKVILVTGGGGSIGSELCRQIAANDPKQLIILDIYENNAHAIGLELKDEYPSLNLEVLIGSVRDSRRINQIFQKYKPEIVYHAAAHKHVPLMEYSPCESVKNNAIGTYKTAYAAMMNGCKRFVLISTDKAVNPTNIMGASKRLCEMIIQSFDRKIREGNYKDLIPLSTHEKIDFPPCETPETEFVAVRFGNVLGSNGSVVPRFKEQIAKGGPVTVTHPDIIRYFMTISEAVSLVLQAGTYAKGGEIFVLDMGSPVKIDTLARNLIRLSGLEPDTDIKIAYTGLRAGEKLYEEKLMNEEGLKTTPNHLIHITGTLSFDTDEFLKSLISLMNAAENGQDDVIRERMKDIVKTYHPA